jgi:hypothetical protein
VETISVDRSGLPGLYSPQEEIESVQQALVLGIRDYMRKCESAVLPRQSSVFQVGLTLR